MQVCKLLVISIYALWLAISTGKYVYTLLKSEEDDFHTYIVAFPQLNNWGENFLCLHTNTFTNV